MPCTETVQGIFCFSEEKPQKSAAAEPEPKLGERRPDMLFDGLDADVEPLGDLPVFRPVVRLNRNTRRHCSESPEMQQSISSLNCDNWNSSSIWSATSVRIQTSNSSSPDSPPRHFLERSKSMARFFTATNSSGSSGRSKSTSSRRSHKARKTSCTMSSDALRSWTI